MGEARQMLQLSEEWLIAAQICTAEDPAEFHWPGAGGTWAISQEGQEEDQGSQLGSFYSCLAEKGGL